VLGTALASAVAAAIITPETFRSLWRDSPPDATDPVVYEQVSSRDKALAMEVPSNWGTSNSYYNDVDGRELGPGLTAGTDPDLPPGYTRPSAFIGASALQAQELGLTGATGPRLLQELTQLNRALDWSKDGCTFDREEQLRPGSALLGVYRVWRSCQSTTSTFYDGTFTDAGGEFVGSVQIFLPEEVPSAVAQHLLSSIRVLPERLPAPSVTRGDTILP
jgi:hypothetical protein